MSHFGYFVEHFYEPISGRLTESTVGIVGVGGGMTITEALCRAGVKEFVLVDHDVVDRKTFIVSLMNELDCQKFFVLKTKLRPSIPRPML